MPPNLPPEQPRQATLRGGRERHCRMKRLWLPVMIVSGWPHRVSPSRKSPLKCALQLGPVPSQHTRARGSGGTRRRHARQLRRTRLGGSHHRLPQRALSANVHEKRSTGSPATCPCAGPSELPCSRPGAVSQPERTQTGLASPRLFAQDVSDNGCTMAPTHTGINQVSTYGA